MSFSTSLDPRVAPPARARRQRGATLLEALFAFVVLALGSVAAAHLHAQLDHAGDVARTRAAAVRGAGEALETMRAFAVVEAASAVRSYASIVPGSETILSSPDDRGASELRIDLQVDAASFAAVKAVSAQSLWRDRADMPRDAVLHSFIAEAPPALAGSLALGAGAAASGVAGAFGRTPAVPVAARALGGGRSVWKPARHGSIALVVDDATGVVVARCDGLAATTTADDLGAADLARCARGRWLAASGTVRFSAASPPRPAAADDAPLPLAVRLELAGPSSAPAPTCSAEAQRTWRREAGGDTAFVAWPIASTPAAAAGVAWTDTGDRFVAWHCLIEPAGGHGWSGRVVVEPVGWTIGGSAVDRRICRYVVDADGSGAIDANIEHPRDYVAVEQALVAQNFLVVRGDAACPASTQAHPS